MTKYQMNGSASAGMLSALTVFVGVLVYAHYYAFPTQVETAGESSAVTEVVASAEKMLAPVSPADAASVSAEAEDPAQPDSVASPVSQTELRIQEDTSEDVAEKAQFSTHVAENPDPQAMQSRAVSSAVAPHRQYPAYGGDYFGTQGRLDTSYASALSQAQYLNARQAAQARHSGKTHSRGDGEFSFTLRFTGRSRAEANAEGNTDWRGYQDGHADISGYQDNSFYPRTAYYANRR